jgi:hypothetical protein
MKKVLTLTAALLTLCASLSLASGLNLSITGSAALADCWAGLASSSATFACNSNTGSAFVCVGSVIPATDVNHFISASVVVDIQVNGATLPPWWQTQSGQCRQSQISLSFDPSGLGASCPPIWLTNPTPIQTVQNGVNGPNRLRVLGIAAVLPADEQVVLADGTEYAVFKLNIGRAKTIGAAPCVGCNTGAAIVLNEIKLGQPAGAPGGDERVTNQADNYCNTMQSGAPVCPGATPTHNRTWGAVKSLYR